MKNPLSVTGLIASVLLAATGFETVSAELPTLGIRPWFGYYAVFTNKRIQLTVESTGRLAVLPLTDKGGAMANNCKIKLVVGFEQVQPDGTASPLPFIPTSFNSTQPATDKLEKAVIQAKLIGEIPVELVLEQVHGIVAISGHVVESKTIPKNSIRMTICMYVPFFYHHQKPLEGKEEKDFQKRIAKDSLNLKFIDGKRKKVAFASEVNLTAAEFNEPAVTGVRFDPVSVYGTRKLEFIASPNSSIQLKNDKTALWKGFTMTWVQDPVKDPEGKARLTIEGK